MVDIDTYKKTGILVFVERLYFRNGPSWHGVGTSSTQVVKCVYQLCVKQDVYLDGEKITPSNATLWQRCKIFFGAQLVQLDSPDKKTSFVLDYVGSTFHATPLGNTGSSTKSLPNFLVRDYKLITNRFFAYGKDPIPQISLYGRPDVTFIIDNGGKGDPIAAAKYDLNTKQLKIIEPLHELPSLMNELVNLR